MIFIISEPDRHCSCEKSKLAQTYNLDLAKTFRCWAIGVWEAITGWFDPVALCRESSTLNFPGKEKPEIPSQTIKHWVKIYWSSHKNYFIIVQTLAFRTWCTTPEPTACPIKTQPDVTKLRPNWMSDLLGLEFKSIATEEKWHPVTKIGCDRLFASVIGHVRNLTDARTVECLLRNNQITYDATRCPGFLLKARGQRSKPFHSIDSADI